MKSELKNKGGWLVLFALFLFGVLFSVAVASSDVVINEIFPNPEGSDKGKEFVEFYNEGDEDIDLEGWVLKKISKKGVVKEHNFDDNDKIKKEEYFEVKFSGLNNDGATIILIDAEGSEVDDKKYDKSLEGKSYNRDEKDKDGHWYWTDETGGDENVDNPANQKYLKIIINEMLPNPSEDETKNEFIELYNPNEKDINLKDWQLRDGSKTGKYTFKKEDKIKAEKYFVVYRRDFKFALNNSGEEVVKLLDPNDDNDKGEYKDKIKYSKTIEGKSYNRNEKDSKKDWYWAEQTVGSSNVENPASKKYTDVLISEILPNPKGEEKDNEFIELYNPNKKEINLKDWILKDNSSSGQYLFSESEKIEAKEYLVVYRKDFDFALNNSGGEIVKLVAPNYKIKSEVEYQSAKEGVSYNFDLAKNNWRWSKFLTAGKINRFNHLPTFKLDKPNNFYRDVYEEFEVRKLKDKDGDEIKIIWDFGDGHKSYLKKTKHKYEKTGKYVVRLVLKDGSEEVIKEFKIKVRKYPKYKLKIVGLMPNPSGKDRGREIILIKNLEKKKINLMNYKIGTGRDEDKVLGHPFYDDFKIESGEIKELVNDDICKFSLLNKGGIVQLLYPNGKVADEIKYGKKKILPNEMYKLDEESGQWYWKGEIGVVNYQLGYDKIGVLGVNNIVDVDITLDNDLKICKTIKQIKIDNWADNWVNKWLF